MPGFVLEEVESPLIPRPGKYPEELLDRGAKLVFESGRPIAHVAADLGDQPRPSASGCARPRPTRASEVSC